MPAGVVAAGAAYEEDFIEIDPSQPEAGATAGTHGERHEHAA